MPHKVAQLSARVQTVVHAPRDLDLVDVVNHRVNFVKLDVQGVVVVDEGVMQEDKLDPIILRLVHSRNVELHRDVLLVC